MAILTSKDRKKLNNAAKKKKNTDTGRTAAEKQRKKSVAENAAAEKKKNKSSASKKKATSSSVLNDTEKKEVEEIRRRTQSLRDRNTAVSQRDAYDAARRKSYGERESVKESKTKFGDIVRSDARDLVQTGSVPKRHYDYGLKKYVTEEESRTASRTRDEYDQNVRASYGARNNQRVEGIYTSGNNTTKKKTSHMEETRQYDDALKNAMKLEPDEMYGVKMGSAEDALKEAEDFSDKNKLQNSADSARLYLNAWDRIDPKDHGQAAAYIVYGIGLNDETRNTVMNAFKNASDDDRIAIYQAAIQTVGYTDDVKKMENQLKSGIKWASDNDYRNKVKTAAFVNSTSTPAQNIQKAAEDLKSGAKGQPTARQINLYNSYQKGIEFSKEWAKTHDYSNMDYFIDKYYGANDAFLAGLIDAVGLNVADLTDVDKEGYLLGGIVSPWKGMSDEKSFLDNGVQMLTNIVNSVLSITKLPLKLMTKGLSYIPGMDESLDEASEEALRWSADLQKAIQFYDFKTEYAGADKSKLVKTAGNIESFVVENIPGIALSIVYPAAGTAVFGAQAGGSYGRAAYESGATLDEAISYGTIAALAEVGTEKLFPMAGTFGKSITERIFSTTAMRTARDKYLYQTTIDMLEKSGFRNSVSGRILKNVLEGGGEATEEMIMEIVNPYLQRAIYDEGAENADLSSIWESGLYGLAVAAVLHLPSNVLNVTGDSLGALRRLNYKITAADQKRDTIKIIRNELSLGLITEEEAKKRLEEADINYALAMELYDVATGKGSLRVAEEAAYEEKTESDTRRIYDSAEEAQKSLENEFKGKKIGDEVKGAYFDGEEVREFTAAKTAEGVKYRMADQTEGDTETYRAKAEKIKNAKNETERSGYQLNVKEDIIREVSAMSKAIGRTIVFDDVAKTYNEDGSANVTRGWFDEKDGSIHVNIHNETPAATVVAHEITHSMEKTKAYKAMQKAVFDYYRSSLGAERKERGALYIEGGKTLENEKDVDYEVMANFVETKLLTDKETINYIVKRNKTFGEKIVNGINRMIQRKIGSKEQKFLAGIRTKWEAALDESRKEGDKKEPSEEGKVAYAVDKEFKNDIKNVFDKEKFKESHLLIGKTPEFLERFGFDTSKPLMMTSKHARDILTEPDGVHTEYHGLSDTELIAALSEMNDPVLVISSVDSNGDENGTLMVLSSKIDKFHNPIGIYVHPAGKGYYNRLEINSNFVKTVYGKDATFEFIKDAAMEHRLLYVNKKKSQQLQYIPGVYFPNNIPSVDFKKNIARYKNIVKGLSVEGKKSSDEGKKIYAFGKERDREYIAAVERGDMETAQRMVDQAAKAAGYDTQKLYHGTNKFGFTKIDTSKAKDGISFFATDKPETASTFSGVGGVRQIGKDTKETSGERNGNYQIYANTDNFFELDAKNNSWTSIPFSDYAENQRIASTKSIARFAKDNGYTGVKISNVYDNGGKNEELFFGEAEPSTVYIFFDPQTQVKSADAVTYDDKGNVIPLSERFDTGNADIRYSYAKEKRGSGEYTYAIGMPVDLEGEKGYISGFRTLESGAVVYNVETFNGIYEDVLQEQIKPRGYEYEAKKETEYRKRKIEEENARDAEFVPRQTPEQREEARNYFVGDIVEIDGERGTVTGRELLKNGEVVYTVELDNGGTVDVSPDELTVGVTTDFFLDELTEEEQRSWDEAPDEWYMGIDLSEELENAVTLKEFSDELYDIGMTISPRKLAQWFKQRKYFKPHRRDNRPSAESLANGYFIMDGKQIYITEKGRNHFSEMFAGKEVKLSKREKKEGVDLPGNERNKEGNPLEESLVKEMLNDYEDEIGSTNEDYWWARLLTGRGVTYSKDYARNFDAAASFNPNVRKHLQRIFVRPLEKAKADYTKAVRNQLNDFHAKMKELGIRKRSDEAAAVQWIGEGQYQDKYGEIHEYTEEMLKKEFPDTWEKIKSAAEYCREIYDQYLIDINQAREKIYPHPVEDAEERKAGYEAKKKLCEERIKEQQAVIQGIEQTIEAKKNELPKKKDGSQAKADVLNSIRYNEDRLVRAKDKLKEYIDRKNNYESLVKKIDADIESGDVLVNKRIVARKDYFHHFQELTMNLGDVFSLSRNTTEIDPKMEGTSEYTQPKSKFSGITVHRKKGRYTADAVEGMIRYVQTGEYMIHIDPTIAEFRNHIKGIAEATKDSRNCNKLIRWLVQWTNDLAGKTNTVDRAIQDRINRNFMKAVKWLNSRAKANAVVGNLNSAAVQFFNIPNAAGYVHNPKYWIGGIKDFVRFVGRKQDVRSLLKQSAFVEERFLDDVINKFDERVIDKPGKLARWTLIVGDRYGTAYIWFTAYRQALGRNEKNPIEYADDITRRCVAGRGIGEIPLTQKSAMTQVFAPFQIEVNNAWQIYKERLGGVVHERTKKGKAASAMGFGTILITNFIFNSVTDLLWHRRVLYDPIYAFFSTLQSWMDDDDEDKDIGDLFSQLMGRQAGEVLSNMPYGSIIAYYAVNNDNLRKKFFGESDPTRFGVGNIALDTIMDLVQSAVNGENIADDMLAIATTFGTPYGGKELERIIEGLVNMGYLPEIKIGRKDGFSAKRLPPGVYNKNGQLQYPVETFSTDWRQALTGMFFGKYATDAGQKYLGKDYEGNSWLRDILGMNQTEPKKPLSERATEVYKNLVAAGGDAFEIYDTIREIQGAENSIDKRNILLNSELTGKEKLSILMGVITAKNNVESETEKINAVLGLGLNIDDYLTIRNMHATINKDESYEKAEDRAWAFNNELIAAGYTTDQIKGIKETLKFYSHIPADTSKFDKLSTSGLDSETSMKVIEVLSALEPLEDETQVSSLQKVEAIAGLNLSAEDEKAAMSLALDKKQYAKYRAVTDYGVTAQVWADFEKALANADANNANEKKRNGSYDKEEKAAALDSMNISNDTKAALWQIKDSKLGSSDKDTAWKAARNPYSSSVGAAVVDAYLSNDQSLTETGAVEEGFGAPLPTGVGRKSSGFGYRTHPISGKWEMHWGVDIAASGGTPVLSVSSGTVKSVGCNRGYGNQVVIELEDGSQFSYSHLKSYGVKKGDVITKGQQIGEVGSTGSSTGNHLHLEAIDANGTKVDPETVVDIFGEGIKTSSEYTAVGGGGASSGGSSGGSRSGGSTGKSTGRSSGGIASGGRRTTGTSTASTGSRRSSTGSGSSGGSSDGVTLPTAAQASAITGRSTKATTYSQGGVTLPTAKDLARSRGTTIASNRGGTETARTGTTAGARFWNENILG